MPGSQLHLPLLFHGLGEVELRVGLRGIGRDGALPTLNRFVAAAKTVCEQAEIHQCIRVLRRAL